MKTFDKPAAGHYTSSHGDKGTSWNGIGARGPVRLVPNAAPVHMWGLITVHCSDGSTKEAMVDLEDLIRCQGIHWCERKNDRGEVYVQGEKDGVHIYLHSYLNRTPKGMDCDHINHNTLDNRKENLCNVTRKQNSANKGKVQESTGLLNVRLKKGGKYEAFYAEKKRTFDNPWDAALWVDSVKVAIYRHARTNASMGLLNPQMFSHAHGVRTLSEGVSA